MFSVRADGMQIFFLKIHINSKSLQFAGKVERVHGVATKSGHALCYDGIYFSSKRQISQYLHSRR